MVTDFESLQSEFYHYMVTVGGIAKKTSRDYISRLKFLAETGGYKLDSNITSEYIDEIMNNEELPNYDKLFDLGYVSFDVNGIAVYSKLLSYSDRKILGLKPDLHLVNIEEQHKKYLKYHNENCFME